jgi:hypothetical protein
MGRTYAREELTQGKNLRKTLYSFIWLHEPFFLLFSEKATAFAVPLFACSSRESDAGLRVLLMA